MRVFTKNQENLTSHRGLYCIWVPARDGEPTPLVARWVDPQAEAAKMHADEDSCAKEEARKTWSGMSTQAA